MRILVVQLKRLGDLVLTTPALAALRQQKPGCRITLAVSRSSADLLPLVAVHDPGDQPTPHAGFSRISHA